MPSAWPLFHIVSDQSRRNLLAARGPGAVPELAEGGVGQVLDFEPRHELERLMRERPVGPARRTA